VSALARLVPLAISAGFVATHGEEIQELMDDSMDLTRQVAAKSELNNIRKSVIQGIAMDQVGLDLHQGSRFSDFIRQELVAAEGGDSARDPWDELYQIRRNRDSYEMFSKGPDGRSDTDDDIWVVLPLR
tara:strand:+ start:324 stop:710 length:387 start_codon:yes stop_codon:yes gene_type:complete